MSIEKARLDETQNKSAHWRRWGPYVSERQWGTVREDYSADGETWDYFTHDQSRLRAYRWGEDGIAGICDNHQRLCFAWAFWNGEDPILKERLFGLTGKEGNHGEDVKEYYFYLDNTPTHSYMQYLYKYPHGRYPYEKLLEENRKRGVNDFEYELLDTGIFNESRYFDLFIEYAKGGTDDIYIRLKAINRGPEKKTLHVLPQFWFRNTWSWFHGKKKPILYIRQGAIETEHEAMGKYFLYFEGKPELLFTENETNQMRLNGVPNPSPYVKDGFHESVIRGNRHAVNPDFTGTKAAMHYACEIPPGGEYVFRLRLTNQHALQNPFAQFDDVIKKRKEEADEYYSFLGLNPKDKDLACIQRQALAGLLWNKQFYHYVVEDWLEGDLLSVSRNTDRNRDWTHLYNDDVLSVPDKWEYPCFFSWDTAFQSIPLALIDPEFAKRQLLLLTREWYMHPNGQMPSYEWSFSDVNPPVHAWAALRVYKIEKKASGKGDVLFLERIFQKLLLNFTWWVNRKDSDGKNVFQGGFLGLDNISVFNRSEQLPIGGKLYQSDATSWMAMYCLNMLAIALEASKMNKSYEDLASKFFEHFLYIAEAINYAGDHRPSLWDEEDGFYYDAIYLPSGEHIPLKVRSMVGLIPLFAITVGNPCDLEDHPAFARRVEWFLSNRTDLCQLVASMREKGISGRRLFSIVHPDRLRRILRKMLSEEEFLSPYGVRSLSKIHEKHPFILRLNGQEYHIDYEPAESRTRIFGGNSNWRGPIWFPLNMLIIESLQRFHYYLGDEYKVECPTGSGNFLTLWEVAAFLSARLIHIFTKDEKGNRPVFGGETIFNKDPHWKDLILYYEYFHGNDGAGLGASHQCGWTGLIAKLINQTMKNRV